MQKKRILILSQVYWPDTSSVSQHLSDLADYLVRNDNEIHVICSRKPYEDLNIRFSKNEIYRGVKITRLNQSKFQKKYILGRLCNFLSFQISVLFYTLLCLSKKDIDQIIVVSVPPLLPLWAVIFAKMKKISCLYWVMDIQPELSAAAGLLNKQSFLYKALLFFSAFMLKKANQLICLDDDMKRHLISRGVSHNKIDVVPVWPVQNKVFKGDKIKNPFRVKWNLDDAFTIMYSGNLAYCHPLDTLLEAALLLKEDSRFRFIFVGTGVQKNKVIRYQKRCPFIQIYPFQRREDIHLSLAAADVHCVVMGDNTKGYTHPNKVYGAMLTGRPILYIGPKNSFISDHINQIKGNISIRHSQTEHLIEKLVNLFDNKILYQEVCEKNFAYAQKYFNKDVLLKKMNDVIRN